MAESDEEDADPPGQTMEKCPPKWSGCSFNVSGSPEMDCDPDDSEDDDTYFKV